MCSNYIIRYLSPFDKSVNQRKDKITQSLTRDDDKLLNTTDKSQRTFHNHSVPKVTSNQEFTKVSNAEVVSREGKLFYNIYLIF